MKGIVKWFDPQKGYGFISAPELDKDAFVHYTGIAGTGFRNLNEGEEVSFDLLTDNPKGLQAVNVSPLHSAEV